MNLTTTNTPFNLEPKRTLDWTKNELGYKGFYNKEYKDYLDKNPSSSIIKIIEDQFDNLDWTLTELQKRFKINIFTFICDKSSINLLLDGEPDELFDIEEFLLTYNTNLHTYSYLKGKRTWTLQLQFDILYSTKEQPISQKIYLYRLDIQRKNQYNYEYKLDTSYIISKIKPYLFIDDIGFYSYIDTLRREHNRKIVQYRHILFDTMEFNTSYEDTDFLEQKNKYTTKKRRAYNLELLLNDE